MRDEAKCCSGIPLLSPIIVRAGNTHIDFIIIRHCRLMCASSNILVVDVLCRDGGKVEGDREA
jgi:hypothetical protein